MTDELEARRAHAREVAARDAEERAWDWIEQQLALAVVGTTKGSAPRLRQSLTAEQRARALAILAADLNLPPEPTAAQLAATLQEHARIHAESQRQLAVHLSAVAEMDERAIDTEIGRACADGKLIRPSLFEQRLRAIGREHGIKWLTAFINVMPRLGEERP